MSVCANGGRTQGFFFQGPGRTSRGSLKRAAGGGRFRKSSSAHSPLPWRDREGEEQKGTERERERERRNEPGQWPPAPDKGLSPALSPFPPALSPLPASLPQTPASIWGRLTLQLSLSVIVQRGEGSGRERPERVGERERERERERETMPEHNNKSTVQAISLHGFTGSMKNSSRRADAGQAQPLPSHPAARQPIGCPRAHPTHCR